MTTICGATRDGIHALAADGRTMWGDRITEDRTPKLHSWGPALPVVGIAGETRTFNLIQAMLEEEPPASVREFVARLRTAMIAVDYHARKEENGGSPGYGFAGLYLSDAGLWSIGCDFSYRPVDSGWPCGVGSGGEVATGAMHARRDADAESLVCLGVEVGKQLDNGSGGGTMLAVRGAAHRGPEWLFALYADSLTAPAPAAPEPAAEPSPAPDL